MAMRDIAPWRETSYRPLSQLHREVDRLFEDFFAGKESDRIGLFEGRFAPEIDISETDKEICVSAELPGIEQKDLEVTMTDDSLLICGEKRKEETEEKKNYYRAERSYGSFGRTIPLPSAVDSAKAKAEFKRGVLTIRLPKSPEVQSQRKRIDVKGE